MCLISGWTSGECLNMPAKRFFAMLTEMRKQRDIRQNLMLADLCDIAAIPMCNADYYEETRNRIIARVTGGVWKKTSSVKMDYKDPKLVQILESIVRQKDRLEGRG